MDRYNAYRANNEEKALALFKVLMNGPAAVWLESLPNTATDTMDQTFPVARVEISEGDFLAAPGPQGERG